MKARFFALMALVLGLASCQTDMVDGVKVDANGEAPVTIQVGLPQEATRAAGQDSGIGAIGNIDLDTEYDIRYILEVYDVNDNLAKRIEKFEDFSTETNFELRLVPGRHYRFVVWADFVEQGTEVALHYDASDLKDVKLTKAMGENQPMDESRDAYTGIFNTEVDGNCDVFSSTTAVDITLTRPFAKLRVVTNDMKELYSDLKTATVKYSTPIYSAFNALNAKPVADRFEYNVEKNVDYSTMCYENEANPRQVGGVQTLFADYLFGTEYDVISFTLDVKDGVAAIPTIEFNTSIPVQRNFLTTVMGPILTDPNNITVTIDSDFAGEKVVDIWDGESKTEPAIETNEAGEPVAVIDSASDLAWLADFVNGLTASTFATRAGNEPVHFVLNADIDLDNMPWTPIGFNPNEEAGNENYFTGTFDGNGHEIRNLYIDVKDKGGVGLFGAVNNATIKNLTLRNVFVKAVESENDPANSSGAEGKTNYIVGGHIGAVAGYDAAPYGTGSVKFENVHVAGLIKIEAETRAAQGQRVGGIIGGRGYSKITFNNVSVIGEEGSYIKGYCSTAGVIGQGQGVSTFNGVTTNIPVYAVTFGAGGISGIACNGSTFTNCKSKGNVTLDASKTQLSSYSANYPFRVGGIAGCWSDSKTGVLTLTNCSYEGNLISIDKDGNSPKSFDYAGYVGRGYALKNCAGSKVIVNDDEYVQVYDTTYGVYYVNGAYEVNTAADLNALANDVNSGKDFFEGKSVVLTADIDLENQEWTPIGSAYMDHGFMGSFDGNGYAIKNLNISNITLDTDGYAYAGLFGVTEGSEGNHNSIKNLTIENVNIKTNGHIVAAAIAYPYYTDLENIKVKGNVSIKGGDYTAGVLAYTRRCVNAKNIAIEANNGSIEGNMTVGGVISDIQMNGGLTANYSNFNASGLTIEANKCVGGISGIISNQTLNGTTVKNVTIVCEDARKGIISGSVGEASVINNVVVENVKGAENFVGTTYDSGKSSKVTIDGVVYEYLADGSIICTVAEISGEKYFTLAEALAVAATMEKAEVTLLADVEWVTGAGIGSTPFIAADAITKELTINANGMTITATGSGVGAIRMANNGRLVFNNVVIVDKSVSYAESNWEYGYLEFAGNLEFNNCKFENAIMVENEGNATFNNCEFNSHKDNEYDVWVSEAKAYFNNCDVNGYRGIKAHEAYGSEIEEIVIDSCRFNNLSKKPGVALGTLNAATKVVIKNSIFTNCQAGDQGLYIYETDTDVNTFNFECKDNTVVNNK